MRSFILLALVAVFACTAALASAADLPLRSPNLAATAASQPSVAAPANVDPYYGASTIATDVRPVKLCTLPTITCTSHNNGAPCGDPEFFIFCHCITNQGQHFCVENP